MADKDPQQSPLEKPLRQLTWDDLSTLLYSLALIAWIVGILMPWFSPSKPVAERLYISIGTIGAGILLLLASVILKVVLKATWKYILFLGPIALGLYSGDILSVCVGVGTSVTLGVIYAVITCLIAEREKVRAAAQAEYTEWKDAIRSFSKRKAFAFPIVLLTFAALLVSFMSRG